jgi:NAD(P)-dependent dehydrogenase (short-subunit alcohol dehydrogenase family)
MPDFGLGGQVCLVTGAGRGIGAAVADALADSGATVVRGLRDAAGADGVQMDVTDLDQIRGAVEQVVAQHGRLDVLVNNAGIGPPETPAEEVSAEDFDATVQLNLRGTFFASQAAGRVMIAQGGGRIVNLSSQAGFVALPGEAVYCMTKAAISHLTKCLAVEWGSHGITVNAVAPTFIETPGTAEALADPGFKADVEERIAALHRIGTPADVAGAVVFLASPAASLITGHTLMVDGGSRPTSCATSTPAATASRPSAGPSRPTTRLRSGSAPSTRPSTAPAGRPPCPTARSCAMRSRPTRRRSSAPGTWRASAPTPRCWSSSWTPASGCPCTSTRTRSSRTATSASATARPRRG